MHILLDPERRVLIAHRGASLEAPENTLPAFQRAADIGVDAFELDLHLSADGVPVVIHDPTLGRTTDRDDQVASCTVAELQAADAGAKWVGPNGSSWAGRGVVVPTLAEILEQFPTMPLLLEIKASAAQQAVAATLKRHAAEPRAVVASFEHRALDAFRRAESAVAVGASRRDIARLFFVAISHLPLPIPSAVCFAVPDHYRGLEVPTPAVVRLARRHRRPVHVWTVDDRIRAEELWERGVTGIITNNPRIMR